MFANEFGQCLQAEVSLVQCAVLADGGCEVVGGRLVAGRPIVEVRAAHEHVEVQGAKAALQGVEGDVLRLGRRLSVHVPTEGRREVAAPAALQFAADEGFAGLRLQLLVDEPAKALADLPAWVTVHHVHHPVQRTARGVARLIRPAGDKRHVDATLAQTLGHVLQIGALLLAREPLDAIELVLHLHEHDTLATHGLARQLVGGHHAADGIVPVGVPGQEGRVHALQPHLMERALGTLAHNPLRKASPTPLGTDVGAGPHDGVQPDLFGQREEAVEFRKVDLREIIGRKGHLAFVPVPGHVGLHAVEARSTNLLQAVAPERFGRAEVVERAAQQEDVVPLYL